MIHIMMIMILMVYNREYFSGYQDFTARHMKSLRVASLMAALVP